MRWFSSDLHLGHEGFLTHPETFRSKSFNDIQTHDETIIERIFEKVSSGDEYYCLGDIFWKYTNEKKNEFFDRFQKRKIGFHWIQGNHDKGVFKHKAIKSFSDIKEIKIKKPEGESQHLVLCHYPLLVWNRSHYNSYNLHGHIHIGDNTYYKIEQTNLYVGKHLNVNVENNNYYPYSEEQVLEILSQKEDNWDFIRR